MVHQLSVGKAATAQYTAQWPTLIMQRAVASPAFDRLFDLDPLKQFLDFSDPAERKYGVHRRCCKLRPWNCSCDTRHSDRLLRPLASAKDPFMRATKCKVAEAFSSQGTLTPTEDDCLLASRPMPRPVLVRMQPLAFTVVEFELIYLLSPLVCLDSCFTLSRSLSLGT